MPTFPKSVLRARRLLPRVACAAAICALATPAGGAAPPVGVGSLAGANVLLITIDTLRADALGAYGAGDGVTPNIDRLAEEGLLFEAAYAHAAMTLPSHASILTGEFPFRHGVRANGAFRLEDSRVTLAERLADGGYRTGAFVGAFVLDVRFGLGQGFEHYDDFYGEQAGSDDFRFSERRAEEVLEPAADWIAGQSGPWFAWAHVFDPHAPYAPPEPFAAAPGQHPYSGEVAYVDHQVGVFLRRLREAGALDNTVIVLTADHGESLGEHGEQTHGAFAYNATLRVPLVIWGGERLAAQVRRDPVGHVDIVPTVLALLGLGRPEAADGTSLLGSDPPPARSLYFEALDGYFTQDLAPLTGIIVGAHKYIDLPLPEVYDLTADPDERRNLAPAEAASVARYRLLLERRLDVEEPSVLQSPALAGLRSARISAIDEVDRRRLEALGYVGVAENPAPREFTVADDPKNALASIEKHRSAVAIFSEGRHGAAIEMLQDVIRARPTFIAAYLDVASMLNAAGRLPEALAVLEMAHARVPRDPTVAGKLGLYHAMSGNMRRAGVLLQGASAVAPDDVELLEHLAVVEASSGRGAEARLLLRRALEIDPSSASAYHNLGLTYARDGDTVAAIEHFERAIALAPDFWYPYEGLAGALVAAGRTLEAVAAWMKLLELHPENHDALYNIGIVFSGLHRDAEALVYLDRFIAQAPSTDPGLARARELAGTIRSRLKRHPDQR